MQIGSSLQEVIKFGSPTHDKLKDGIRARKEYSLRKMRSKHKTWREAEDTFQAYVKKDDGERLREDQRKNKGKQTYVELTVPYSYAALMTAHTYWTSVFLARNPVFQFSARHGEPEMAVQAVEALLDYQLQVGQMLVPLYLWLVDAGKYGLGVVGTYWEHEQNTVARIVEEPLKIFGLPIPGKTKRTRQAVQVDGYVGSKLFNVRPYDFFPDPRVPVIRFHEGEYVGRTTQASWNEILRGKQTGRYFNIDKLSDIRFPDREAGSSNLDMPVIDEPIAEMLQKGRPVSVDLFELIWDIVPSEYGIGKESAPQKWAFTLAQDNVIIGAQPLGLWANRFPYFVQAYDIEAYGFSGRGVLELLEPLNATMDWLFNSHFYNVRKVLNDQFVVDPSRVVMKDLEDGGPGKLIRLHPRAYGTDVRTAVAQLQVVDVTQNNLADIQRVAEVMQRITGVNDNLMGLVYPGGRKTATEVRTSSSLGINRLKTIAEYNSALGWAPLASYLLQVTQQLYDMQRQFKIAGELLQNAERFVKVDQESIQGFYDFVPVDGTMPIDRFAQANLWKEIIMGMARFPQLSAQYDVAAIFSWMAQLAGLKNINQFRVQVTPDAMAAEMAAAGKVVPIGAGAVNRGAPGPQTVAGIPLGQ